MLKHTKNFSFAMVLVLAAALLSLAAWGAWFYQNEKQAVRNKAAEQLTTIGKLKADQIAWWRRERINDAHALINGSPLLVEAIIRYLDDPRDDDKNRLLTRFQSLITYYEYADVLLVDHSGRIHLSLSEKTGTHAEYMEALETALGARRPVFTELHVDGPDTAPHISVVTPIIVAGKPEMFPKGAVILVSDASLFLYPLIQSWPVPSQTAETVLFRQDGDHILFLNDLRHQPGTALKLRIPMTQTDLPSVMALQGRQGLIEGTDYRGISVLTVIHPVPDSSWFVIAKQDAAEVYAEWHLRAKLIFLLFAALATVLVAISLIMWQRNKKVYYRDLHIAQTELRRIQWLLTSKPAADGKPYVPAYGDLTASNKDGLIKRSIEPHVLNDIAFDYLNLLNTSAAIYEKNGDYALGIFSSSWCQFMDGASRRLCGTEDNRAALASGKWLCHESCWTHNADKAIETGQPIDIECHGGIHMYGVPIIVNGEAVGAINIGYGDPPRDPARLSELAERYQVSVDDLRRRAEAYETRPPFIIELAKKRLEASARLIGEIIERKQAEEALNLERQRLAAIIKGTHTGTWEWNVQTGETVFNQRWAEIIGYALEELAPVSFDTWMKFVHPEDVNISQDRLNQHFSGQLAYYECEVRMRHKKGHWVWVLDRGKVSSWTDDGKPLLMQGTHQDISDQRQAREKLFQLEKGESLGRMAGAIAHHYNNLLAIIMGNLELTIDDLDPHRQSEAVEKLNEAMTTAHRAARLSSTMLAYLGQDDIHRQPVDLSAVCRSALSDIRAGLPAQVTLDADISLPGPAVLADTDQIRRIIDNLLANAGEALGDVPGRISLRIGTARHENIPAEHRWPADFEPGASEYACLEVTDTGRGIEKRVFSKLFDPFYSTKFIGRGLGLSVVLGAVKAHDGCITVNSTPGAGSAFRVFLPLTAETVPASETPRQPQVMSLPENNTVLVIDDEPTVRKLSAKVIRQMGLKALEADDGDTGLELFREHQDAIGCVICDLTMPRMSGWETLAALREIAFGIPVILASGYDQSQAMAGGHDQQPNAFLHKPYRIQELKDAILTALQGNSREI